MTVGRPLDSRVDQSEAMEARLSDTDQRLSRLERQTGATSTDKSVVVVELFTDLPEGQIGMKGLVTGAPGVPVMDWYDGQANGSWVLGVAPVPDGVILVIDGLTVNGNLVMGGSTDHVVTRVVRTNDGSSLVLMGGESVNFADLATLTSEHVYAVSESGLRVVASPNNWVSGWAGRRTMTLDPANLGGTIEWNDTVLGDKLLLHPGFAIGVQTNEMEFRGSQFSFEENGDAVGRIWMNMAGAPRLYIESDSAAQNMNVYVASDYTRILTTAPMFYMDKQVGSNGGFKSWGSGSAALPPFTFNGDEDTGIYRNTTNSIGFTAGGIEVALMESLVFRARGIEAAATGAARAVGLTGTLGKLIEISSSRRYKRDIRRYDSAPIFEFLDNAEAVFYRNLTDEYGSWAHMSFIAEDLAEIDERLVTWVAEPGDCVCGVAARRQAEHDEDVANGVEDPRDPDHEPHEHDPECIRPNGLHLNAIAAATVAGVQDLRKRVATLEADNADLRAAVQALKKRLDDSNQ